MKKIFLCMSMLFSVSSANAQIPTTDIAALVQRITMIISEAEQLVELVNQVEETEKVVEQTTNAAKSLQEQLETSLNINQQQAVNAVLEKVRQANAIANGDAAKELLDSYSLAATFEKSYQATSASNRQAAASNASVLDSLPDAGERLNKLVNQSQAATGALQAQQAGNQISAELAGQLMALRQQLALQGQAQSADQEMRTRQDAAQAEITRQFFGGTMK